MFFTYFPCAIYNPSIFLPCALLSTSGTVPVIAATLNNSPLLAINLIAKIWGIVRTLIVNLSVCFPPILSWLSWFCLTYQEIPDDGTTVKAHLEAFAKAFKRKYKGHSFVWTIEFQNRGAIHFHCFCTLDIASLGDLEILPRKGRKRSKPYWTHLPSHLWLCATWNRIVGGSEAHLKACAEWEPLDSTDGAARYISAHQKKRTQKKVPDQFQNLGKCWGKIGGPFRLVRLGSATMTAAEVFESYGPLAMSKNGRLNKYLYGHASRVTLDPE